MHSHTLLFSHIVFVCPRSVEHTNEEWVLFFFKAFYFNEIVFKRGHTNKGKKHTINARSNAQKVCAPLGRQQQSANENFIYIRYIKYKAYNSFVRGSGKTLERNFFCVRCSKDLSLVLLQINHFLENSEAE